MRSTRLAPDLRGLILVVLVCAWLAGILLSSWLLLPALPLLIGTGIASVLVVLLWRDSTGRLITLIVFSLLLGAWRYASVSPTNDPQAISAFIGATSHTTLRTYVRGSVASEPQVQGRLRVLYVDASAVSINGGNSWQDAHGQVEVKSLGTLIEDPYGANYGDSVELQGNLQTPPPHSPPGVFASMLFPRISMHGAGGNPIIAALYSLRVTLANVIAQSLPQPEAALLIAIVLGLHTPALKSLLLAFNVTGTAHLIVSSGFKVTILAGLIASSTRWLYEGKGTGTASRSLQGSLFYSTPPSPLQLPAQKRRGQWRRWIATGLVVASIAAYTILSGVGPAAIRAGIMGILLVIAPRLGRIYNIYTALALTALLMSIIDPFILWDAGFQLSLLGTLGIVLLTPLLQRLFRSMDRLPFGHHIAELLAVTFAAQIATLPIMALTFQEVSFIAPLANLLTVPLLGVLILLGMLICGVGLLFAPLGVICGWAAWPLLWYVGHVIAWCAGLPGAYVRISDLDTGVAWAYYGVLALVTSAALRRWPSQQRVPPGQAQSFPPAMLGHTFSPAASGAAPGETLLSRRGWRFVQIVAALLVIIATGATALAAQPDGRLTVMFLSVGPAGQPAQGEAILITTPDGKTVLIDGGPDASALGQELDSRLPFWKRSLDMVVLTTPRPDHLAGLQDIITRYAVGEVVDAGMLHPNTGYALWRRTIAERGLQYVQVRQGASIEVGGQVTLQVLWPASPLHKGSDEERDNALVLHLIAPGLRMLLLGVAAQSKFALSGLLTGIDQGYLQSSIVQMVGEASKGFPVELSEVLQVAHPALLVVTPSSLSPRQRKAGTLTVMPTSVLAFGQAAEQVIQTAQMGTMEVSANTNGWNLEAV